MRLAILDDDSALGAHISKLMTELGHTTLEFRNGKSMLKELRQNSFDLLLLDWSLPDTSGIEVLGWGARTSRSLSTRHHDHRSRGRE